MAAADHPYRTESVGAVTIIGPGLIGGAWSANFLSRGLKIRAYDPQHGAEARLRDVVGEALDDLRQPTPIPRLLAGETAAVSRICSLLIKEVPSAGGFST